jgi:hypothetical protein
MIGFPEWPPSDVFRVFEFSSMETQKDKSGSNRELNRKESQQWKPGIGKRRLRELVAMLRACPASW